MKINRLDIGQEVRRKVEESGMSKAKFAELLGIARQNIEKTVFQKRSLDTDLLCNISEVLNCNFFDYFKSDSVCNKTDYKEKKEVKENKSKMELLDFEIKKMQKDRLEYEKKIRHQENVIRFHKYVEAVSWLISILLGGILAFVKS